MTSKKTPFTEVFEHTHMTQSDLARHVSSVFTTQEVSNMCMAIGASIQKNHAIEQKNPDLRNQTEPLNKSLMICLGKFLASLSESSRPIILKAIEDIFELKMEFHQVVQPFNHDASISH